MVLKKEVINPREPVPLSKMEDQSKPVNAIPKMEQHFYAGGLKLFLWVVVIFCLAAGNALGLEVKFTEFGKPRTLNREAVDFFGQILPEAAVLDLHIVKEGEKKLAVMIVLFDKQTEDGFNLVKEIPHINSYTYMIAWMLQGHFDFLDDQAVSIRQKRHLNLLGRYFRGRSIKGADSFNMGDFIKLYYEPDEPRISGVRLADAGISKVLYSGYPREIGFGKISVEGFNPKFIAVFPN